MVAGALIIELFLPGCASLKDKRQIIKSIMERTKARYNVSITEVDYHDLWQRATLGVAYASQTHHQAEKLLNKVSSYIENLNKATIIKEELFFLQPDQ